LTPFVTIILPAFNAVNTIEECLDSLVAQVEVDFEILVIDDGSTDSTGEIAKRFSRAYEFVYYLYKPNGGIVTALNFGISKARGNYIARMDADDIAMPNRLKIQLDYMISNNLDVCGGYINCFSDQNSETIFRTNPINKIDQLYVLIITVPVFHPTVIFKKSIVVPMGYEVYRPVVAEDYDLWVRLFLNGCKFGNIDEIVLHYRLSSSSLSKLNANKIACYTYSRSLDLMTRLGRKKMKDYLMSLPEDNAFSKRLAQRAMFRFLLNHDFNFNLFIRCIFMNSIVTSLKGMMREIQLKYSS
jgi:O86/O127-antigen biosynthesis beta-1,3-galactosyltransferase